MLYIAIFLVVFVFYIVTYGTDYARNPLALGIPLLVLCLVVGFGDMLGGYDRYIYAEVFDQAADQVAHNNPVFTDDITLYSGYKSEMAYVIWNAIIAHITANRYIFILFSTIFMYVLIYRSIRDYIEDNYLFAVMVFMGIWFFFTFTYIRQVMATCVAWYGMRYVVKRKPVPFFICAFIAYEFHNSAIVFAPIYFLPIRKWEFRSVLIVMAILFIIGATGITSSLYSLYGDVSSDDRNKGYNFDDTGGRVAYLVEAIVFLYFLYKRYDEITSYKDVVFLNAALCFVGMLMLFFRSSNAGRQSWYFAIGFIYLFTKLATHNKTMDSYGLYLLALFFGLYLRIVIAWGGQISPYKTFFTEGYRQEDPIIEQYEYDWRYESKKMYRKPFRIVLNDWK